MSRDLPKHLAQGRTSFPGPVTGGYMPWTFGPLAIAGSDSDTIRAVFQAPMAMRLHAIAWASAAAADAGTSFQVAQASTIVWDATETDMMTGDILLDTNEFGFVTKLDLVQTFGLVEVARDVAKDVYVMVGCTGGTTGLVDFNVTLLFTSSGFHSADPAAD